MRDTHRPGTASRALARQRARRRRARCIRAALATIGAAALLGGYAAGREVPTALANRLPELPVREVRVAGTPRVAVEPLLRAAGVVPGAALAPQAREALARRLEEDRWVRRAHVAWLPPGTVVVGLEERRPVAWTRVAGHGDEAWVVDGEAVAFDRASPAHREHLPELRLPAPPAPGETDASLQRALAVLDAATGRGLPAVRVIGLAGDDPAALPELELDGLAARVIVGQGALASKLDRLAFLLRAELPDTRAARWIDLRFDQRVVLKGKASRTGASPSRPRADARARCNRESSGVPGLPNQGVRATCHERTT